MKLPDPALTGRRTEREGDLAGNPDRPQPIGSWIADFWTGLRRSSEGVGEGPSVGETAGSGPTRLGQAFGWLAPATAASITLAALAGATLSDHPPLLGAAVIAVALGFLLLLWRTAAWILGGSDASDAASTDLKAELVSAREREKELRSLAYRDSLTGLPNRSLFYDRLGLAIRHSARERSLLAVLFLDLDGFKAVNDFQGHLFGDRLLVALAERIDASVRAEDTVARLGGDEFVVLLPKVAGAADAASVAAKILDALRAPFRIEGAEVSMSASVGVSVFPDDGLSADLLVSKADRAMYRAKQIRRRVHRQLDAASEASPGRGFGIDASVPALP